MGLERIACPEISPRSGRKVLLATPTRTPSGAPPASEPLVHVLPARTCFCVPSLHPLRGWKLRQTRCGSVEKTRSRSARTLSRPSRREIAVVSLVSAALSLFARVGNSHVSRASGVRRGAKRWPRASDPTVFPVFSRCNRDFPQRRVRPRLHPPPVGLWLQRLSTDSKCQREKVRVFAGFCAGGV